MEQNSQVIQFHPHLRLKRKKYVGPVKTVDNGHLILI